MDRVGFDGELWRVCVDRVGFHVNSVLQSANSVFSHLPAVL